ncbi:MAG: hypothetical protein HFACDABA_02177 [Anaerolineales bacterium]|nr:hypothetical protein [Anaerolineales bacterium]
MTVWLILLLGGLITFGLRFSFVYLLGRLEIPSAMRRALHYVPPAVLSAIIVPELFLHNNVLDASLDNTRLLAGIAAILVAAWTKNSLLTILTGMAALFLLQFIGAR